MPDKEKDLLRSIAEQNQWNNTMTLGQRFLSGSQPSSSNQPNSYQASDSIFTSPFVHQTGLSHTIGNGFSFNDLQMPGAAQYASYLQGNDMFNMFVKDSGDEKSNTSSQVIPSSTPSSFFQGVELYNHHDDTAHTVSDLISQGASQLINIPSNIPPSIPMKLMFSSSGFDVVGALVKMATRENPKIEVGPIDMTCSFIVSDIRLPDMPIIYVSPTFEQLTGYPTQEILDPSGQVYPGSTRSYTDHNVVQRMKICITERQEGQFTLVNYKKTGEPFLNHLTMIPISFSSTGEMTHYIGLQIDLIHQPRTIMKRLSSILDSYIDGTYSVNYQGECIKPKITPKDLTSTSVDVIEPTVTQIPSVMLNYVESTSDVIFVLSLRGLFLHVSPKSCNSLLHYEPAELIGHKIGEFIHPSDLVSVMRDLRNCSADGTINFICRIRRKNAAYCYMEMNGKVYSGSKRNRCFILAGRELYVPLIPLSSFYYPESIPENETWVKISKHGLILYATATCHYFFGINQSSIHVHSIYDFIEVEEYSTFSNALTSESNQVTQCTFIASGKKNLCLVRTLLVKDPLRSVIWLQIKKNPTEMNFMATDVGLFGVIEGVKASSLFYECNKLKVKITKIMEELESL